MTKGQKHYLSFWLRLWRAGNDGKPVWRASLKHLKDILTERYGDVSAREWNRHPSRRHETVVAVAEEIEWRMGLGPRLPG